MQFARITAVPDLRLARIRVHLDPPRVDDIAATVREQFRLAQPQLPPGARIAVAVGSRGISNLPSIVRATVECLTAAGARPFIVPAMGSHGGATAEGQEGLLRELGVTAATAGCPIESGMDVIELPNEGLGHGLYMDARAATADGIVLINRIKPHTDFHGPHESGLAKMAVIGLGKERQAFEMHRFGTRGLREFVPRAAGRLLATRPILLGIGVVENALDQTALIEAIRPADLLRRETELLEIARRQLPRLPVDDLDLLIVDQLGKDISGTGMDTNVIGRIRIESEPEPVCPRIRSIVVTGLTPASHGNATGTGLADVVTRRLFEQIDFGVTYTNLVTSGFLERAKLPLVAATDRDAVAIALRGLGGTPPDTARIARIRDTLHLAELLVSPPVLNDLRRRQDIELLAEPAEVFDADGSLLPL